MGSGKGQEVLFGAELSDSGVGPESVGGRGSSGTLAAFGGGPSLASPVPQGIAPCGARS